MKSLENILLKKSNILNRVICTRKQQENQEKAIKKVLQSITSKVKENLSKNKYEREQNEEIMINLVEQVIEKLKLEMVEFDL